MNWIGPNWLFTIQRGEPNLDEFWCVWVHSTLICWNLVWLNIDTSIIQRGWTITPGQFLFFFFSPLCFLAWSMMDTPPHEHLTEWHHRSPQPLSSKPLPWNCRRIVSFGDQPKFELYIDLQHLGLRSFPIEVFMNWILVFYKAEQKQTLTMVIVVPRVIINSRQDFPNLLFLALNNAIDRAFRIFWFPLTE
jgi:hypothetical protein